MFGKILRDLVGFGGILQVCFRDPWDVWRFLDLTEGLGGSWGIWWDLEGSYEAVLRILGSLKSFWDLPQGLGGSWGIWCDLEGSYRAVLRILGIFEKIFGIFWEFSGFSRIREGYFWMFQGLLRFTGRSIAILYGFWGFLEGFRASFRDLLGSCRILEGFSTKDIIKDN